mgnify:CR=1 FL=1
MEAAEMVKWSGKELGGYRSAMEDLDQLRPDLMGGRGSASVW